MKLAHDRRPVRLHGFETYSEDSGDLFVRVPLGDQLHHTAFPVGESRSVPGRAYNKRVSSASEILALKKGLCDANASIALMRWWLASVLSK